MKTHEIKLNEEFCDSVLRGEKTFEIRKNDRGYQKGDHIRFIPVTLVCGASVPLTDNMFADKEYEITYVLSGWGLQDGFVALAIKEISTENAD